MIRLFANMTAGHVVIIFIEFNCYFANRWIAPAFFGFHYDFIIELLVTAFLQAYIFTFYALYFGMARRSQ